MHEHLQTYYKDVTMPGGWTHNLPDRLKTNELYYLGKFKTGMYDGKFRKFFYNITKPACDVATKFIDIDTQNIVLVPERSGDEWATWLFSRELTYWMKVEHFGNLLNEVGHKFPKGHIVLKRVNGGLHMVNLMNLRTDPTCRLLKDSPFVYEVHQWSRDKVLSYPGAEKLRDRTDKTFVVYEEYIKEGTKWKRRLLTDCFSYVEKGGTKIGTEALINESHEYLPPIVLEETEITKWPYYEVKWEEVEGRWLGMGFIEYLEDNQVAINEAENLERKALHFKALNVWYTADDTIGGQNALNDFENGDFILTPAPVAPLQKENADLSAYNNTRSYWKENTERKTFTSDITTGANLPSRTPLGVANLQASLATSYFDLKRENLGLFWKNLFEEVIIPDLLPKVNKKHTQLFSAEDQELDMLHSYIIREKVNRLSKRYEDKTGYAPAQIVIDDFKAQIKRQLNETTQLFVEVEDGFYKDARFKVKVVVTDENIDIQAKSSLLGLVLQLYNANPGIVQDPFGKSVLFKLLSLGGESPIGLNLGQAGQNMIPGGSVATPQSLPGVNQPQLQV